MKFLSFAILIVLLVTSCDSWSPQSGVAESKAKREEAMAKEIVSIDYSFSNVLSEINNTNVADFVAKAEPLVSRLEKISRELDEHGPFSTGLREATLLKLEPDANMSLLKHITTNNPSGFTGAAQVFFCKII